MTHTITALFDDRGDAEAAKARLTQSRVDADHIQIHDKSSTGYNETTRSTHEERGIWASIKNVFLPEEDRHTYEEGVRRGGVLLTADVDDDAVADAVRVLEEAKTIDIDERSQSWRSSGWDHAPVAAGAASNAGAIPSTYARRDLDRGTARARSYVNDRSDRGSEIGTKLAGMTNEAVGNVKQAAGSVFDKDELKHDGEAQERKGELQQGRGSDKTY